MMALSRIVFVCFLFVYGVGGISFTITPQSFVPGVTSSVNMRCGVADSGSEMSQLLVIQLEVMSGGSMVPLVTFTSATGPRITDEGIAVNAQVDGEEHQFQDIRSSYLSVTFPVPAEALAGNYTCVVSGLSSSSLLVRYTKDMSLTLGSVDLLPHFMTAEVVEIRSLIENIKALKNDLLLEATQLRDQEQNATDKLSALEQEYVNLTGELMDLRTRASQLHAILNKPTSELDHLSSVRPEMKVAFHAALSDLGAKTAVLREPLVFDHVVTNEGQGYNSKTGAFTAPVAGTYLFTVSVEAGPGNRNSELSIMMGDKILQTMHMSDDLDYQHSTTSALASVPAGAEITCEFTWLEGLPGYVGSTEANAPYVTAFTGYILW